MADPATIVEVLKNSRREYFSFMLSWELSSMNVELCSQFTFLATQMQ